MKAVVVKSQSDGSARLQLVEDYPEPEPAAGEVRIRTTLAGICNTDLEIIRGYAGFGGVLGHEFVGIVDQSEDSAWIGRRVVGEINAPCGHCLTCRAGRPTHCPQRTTLGIGARDGVLAQYFNLPASNLHPVPEELSDRAAVFAEPLAAACQILEQVQIRPTDRVIVLGDGKLGLLVAQVLATTGCDLLAVGRYPEKLAILEARGIATRIGLLGDEGEADIVVECTGNAEGFKEGCHLVRPRGTMVLKSTYHGLVQADLSHLVVNEVTIVGSRCGPFPAALRHLAQDRVDVLSLIDAEYALDDALVAFDHAARPGALKVLLRA